MGYSAEQLIAVAKAEVGYLEKASNSQLDDKTANAGKANYTKYARDLNNAGYYNGNKNGYDWCDVFVDWCHFTAAGKDAAKAQSTICQTGPLGAGCTFSMRYYKSADRWYSAPLPGDQIFINWNSGKADADHTGIVYKVDTKKVYTIEGNTYNSTQPGVYKLEYSLTDSRIVGYGRPLYDEDSSITPEIFEQNSEAVQSATKHNFFTTNLKTVFSTEAYVQVKVFNNKEYKWSYQLRDLTNSDNADNTIPVTVNQLDSIGLTGLKPYTPYVLTITAISEQLQSSQQLFFSTTQDVPAAVSNLKATFDDAVLINKKCNVTFSQPKTWGSYVDSRDSGYRISLLLNGQVVSYSDNLIYPGASTVNKTISLLDFLKIDKNFELAYGDLLQIGVQTWVKDKNGEVILNSSYPMCTQPIYLGHLLKPVNKFQIKIADNFKRVMLWPNN